MISCKLFLGFFDTGYILERGFLLLRGQQTRARFAEAQRFISAGLHLPHHDEENNEKQQEGNAIDQETDPVIVANFLDIDIDVFRLEFLGQVAESFLRYGDVEFCFWLAEFAIDFGADRRKHNRDFADVALLHLGLEVGVARRLIARRLTSGRGHSPEQDGEKDHCHPE